MAAKLDINVGKAICFRKVFVGWPDSIPSVGQIPIRQLSKLKKK